MDTNTTEHSIPLEFEKDGSFVVKEFRALDIGAAVVFYLIFFLALANLSGDYKEQDEPMYLKIFLLTLIPALAYTRKAFNNQAMLKINSRGIYVRNILVTNWQNFVSAKYSEQEITGSIKDNFILNIYYYKADGVCYVRRIPEINTQSRAEEEVIAAIKHFYNQAYPEKNINNY